jgi:hypothetical protein
MEDNFKAFVIRLREIGYSAEDVKYFIQDVYNLNFLSNSLFDEVDKIYVFFDES